MALLRRFEATTLVLFLGLTLLSCGANVIRGIGDNGVYDVTHFGATPDGKLDSGLAFTKAWNGACHSKVASTVLIPEGVYEASEVMFHGPCTNTVTLDVQGSVLADPDPSKYPNHVWLSLHDINGLVIKGKGMFDGQGKLMWQYFSCRDENGTCENTLVPSFGFQKVHNVVIDGLTSRNSMGYNIVVDQSSNITFQNVHIFAPLDSPHTDGIHVTQSQGINVVSGDIETGGVCVFNGDSGVRVDPAGVICREKH